MLVQLCYWKSEIDRCRYNCHVTGTVRLMDAGYDCVTRTVRLVGAGTVVVLLEE